MEVSKVGKIAGNQNIYIENRGKVTITDVIQVGSFNDETVLLSVDGNGIAVKGQNLHIQKLDLEEGKVIITGHIQSAAYTEKRDKDDGGFLKKLLK
ncbi:MAG: YabP/YqfC family sporulation protein [Anaerovoracaceae bacterium]|jgi:sporulation protein YabP